MGRPLSVTDNQIIEATERVIARQGPAGLTVSEVAREVGLSRAAITLRFAGVDELRRHLLQRMAERFEERVASLRPEVGAAGLLAIAEALGGMLSGREELGNFWLRYYANIADPLYRSMEERRGRVLRDLIALAMPETRLEKAEAVDCFMTQMSGSILNWQAGDVPDAATFLRGRALTWIRLAGIPLDEPRP